MLSGFGIEVMWRSIPPRHRQIGGRLCNTSEVIRLIRRSSLANNQPSDTMATMMITICGVHASLRRLCGHENASFSQLSHLCHKLLCRLLTCQYDQLRRESTDKRVIIPGLVIKNGSCAAELYEGLATHRYNPALDFRRAAQGCISILLPQEPGARGSLERAVGYSRKHW